MTLPNSLPIALPGLYFTLLVITLVSGEGTASGGNPLFCLSLPWSLPLAARDDTKIMFVVGILATLWWWLIGHIGHSGYLGKLSRVGAALGSGLILFMCVIEAALMGSELRLISQEPQHFSGIDVAIYTLASALLAGGLISAGCAAFAVFRRK